MPGTIPGAEDIMENKIYSNVILVELTMTEAKINQNIAKMTLNSV